jgi:hypothetical protein
MLNFAYIDNTEVISIPSQKNGGLYSGEDVLDKYEWSGNYMQPKLLPNAETYSSQFLSKNILPYDDRSSGRYNNNSVGTR